MATEIVEFSNVEPQAVLRLMFLHKKTWKNIHVWMMQRLVDITCYNQL